MEEWKNITVLYFAVYSYIISLTLLYMVNYGVSVSDMKINYTLFSLGLIVNIIIFLRATEREYNLDKSRRKLFFLGLVWGGIYTLLTYLYDIAVGGTYHLRNYFGFIGTVAEIVIFAAITLFITVNLFYHLSLRDLGFLFPVEKMNSNKIQISNNKYLDIFLRFILFPAIAGTLIGAIGFIITGNFGSSGGITLIGSLVSVGTSAGTSPA